MSSLPQRSKIARLRKHPNPSVIVRAFTSAAAPGATVAETSGYICSNTFCAAWGSGPVRQNWPSGPACRSTTVIDRLLNYENFSTDHDSKIGQAAYVGITTAAGQPFSANTLINDARQRWLFRMIHSERPLEEKMALFWHNHFATAYSKIAGAVGQERATRMMDNDPSSLPGSQPGQIQTLRQHATGNFRDMLLAMARDPAMIYWLDSQLNTRTRPQENFGREIMELFSLGIGNYTEQDVYTAARVFTGFNWQLVGDRASTPDQLLHVPLPARRSRPQRQRVHASRSIRTAAARFPRAPPRRASRTPSTSSTRWRGTRPRRGGWRRGSTSFSSTRRRRLIRRWSSAMAQTYLSNNTTSRRRCARCSGRRSSAIRPTSFNAIRGRSSTWCAPSRKSAGPASRSTPR